MRKLDTLDDLTIEIAARSFDQLSKRPVTVLNETDPRKTEEDFEKRELEAKLEILRGKLEGEEE